MTIRPTLSFLTSSITGNRPKSFHFRPKSQQKFEEYYSRAVCDSVLGKELYQLTLLHTTLQSAFVYENMASDKGIAIVLMGVSGAGKSTIGGMLAKAINGCFIDADDYHPQSNKNKMKSGIPLTDEDRIPWLETLRDALRERLVNGETVILGCSALQKHYREILRQADPNYVLGSYVCDVKFVLLNVGAEVLAARLEKRAADGNHFMPAKLLRSQLNSLQIDESEGILMVDASLDPEVTLKTVQCLVILRLCRRENSHDSSTSD